MGILFPSIESSAGIASVYLILLVIAAPIPLLNHEPPCSNRVGLADAETEVRRQDGTSWPSTRAGERYMTFAKADDSSARTCKVAEDMG